MIYSIASMLVLLQFWTKNAIDIDYNTMSQLTGSHESSQWTQNVKIQVRQWAMFSSASCTTGEWHLGHHTTSPIVSSAFWNIHTQCQTSIIECPVLNNLNVFYCAWWIHLHNADIWISIGFKNTNTNIILHVHVCDTDGFMQERRNSIVNALELLLTHWSYIPLALTHRYRGMLWDTIGCNYLPTHWLITLALTSLFFNPFGSKAGASQAPHACPTLGLRGLFY